MIILERNKFPIDPIMRVSDLRFSSPSYYRKEQVESNDVPQHFAKNINRSGEKKVFELVV